MNLFNRAAASVLRKKGKSLTLLLLLFILSTVLSGAISIRRAVQNTEASLRLALPAVATVGMDIDALQEDNAWERLGLLRADDLRRVGELHYVKDFDYTVDLSVYSQGMARFFEPNAELGIEEDWNSLSVQAGEALDYELFNVRGVFNPSILDIQAGIIQLTGGRAFEPGETNAMVVSRAFADQNGLVIGSEITLESLVIDEREAVTWTSFSDRFDHIFANLENVVTVVGIFELVEEVDTGDAWSDFSRKDEINNRIYLPAALVEEMNHFVFANQQEIFGDDPFWAGGSPEDMIFFQPVYLLHDSRDLDAFGQAGNELLPEFWRITDLSGNFADITSSMDNLLWIADIVFWVSALATMIITSLLVTLSLRDRRAEIGIYLALGEQKLKVAGQVVLELMVIALVSITLAVFTGNLLSGAISTQMIRSDLQQPDEGFGWGMMPAPGGDNLHWFNPGPMTTEEMIQAYDTSLDPMAIAMFYGVGLVVILISAGIPIFYVMRLDPKKILM